MCENSLADFCPSVLLKPLLYCSYYSTVQCSTKKYGTFNRNHRVNTNLLYSKKSRWYVKLSEVHKSAREFLHDLDFR